jgi:endonuclease/exonuclease/phosphatase (EEP) superfamily protein YafD
MFSRADCGFGAIKLSTSYWPIVVTEYPKELVPDADSRALLAHLEELMHDAVRTQERLFFITDLTAMREVAPASQRQYTGQWIKRTSELARASAVGSAQVTPSAILRGIITAIFWVSPSPTSSVVVATRAEAMMAGIRMLEKHHIPLSDRLALYRDGAGLGSR